MLIPVAAGDIVCYDIYYVSVPHVHGGQQHVINFDDHHVTLNSPYLLACKPDAIEAIILHCVLQFAQSHSAQNAHGQRWGPYLDTLASSYFSKASDSLPFPHTERANANGARWLATCVPNWRRQSYQHFTGDIISSRLQLTSCLFYHCAKRQ
eukprot:1215068-Pleurochrysis_carterae.AAC.1